MLLDDIFANVPESYTQADRDLIEKAYYFAEKAHEGQKRASGEPYFTHCVAVALILCEMKVQSMVVAAALLHDTVEDTPVTTDDITREFGAEICTLVDGVTKLTHLPNTNRIGGPVNPGEKDNDQDQAALNETDKAKQKQELKNATLRKTLVAMTKDIRVMIIKLADRLHNMRTLSYTSKEKQKDIRVMIIKLADRLHNMRTLSYTSKEKQKRIAQETLDIYAPIANVLGIWRIKWELEDLAFRYIHPNEYAQIAENLAATHSQKIQEQQEGLATRFQQLSEFVQNCDLTILPEHEQKTLTDYLELRRKWNDSIYDPQVAAEEKIEIYKACQALDNSVRTILEKLFNTQHSEEYAAFTEIHDKLWQIFHNDAPTMYRAIIHITNEKGEKEDVIHQY